MNQYKMIFFDMDGTLLSHRINGISKKNQEMMKQLKQQGYKLAIATGRDVANVEMILKRDHVMSYFDVIIGQNGYHMYDLKEEKDFYFAPLTTKHLKEITTTLQDFHVNFLYLEDGAPVCFYDNDMVEHITRIFSNYRVLKPEELFQKDLPKLSMFSIPEEFLMVQQTIKEANFTEFYSVQTGPQMLEFQATETSKWKSIERYLAQYHILPDEIICLGDSENDYEMLQHAGLAVAMQNAPDQIKELADEVTKHEYEDDGIYYYFEEKIKNQEL